MKKKLHSPRRAAFKQMQKVVRIYCNGEVTEVNYFKALLADLRITSASIKIVGKEHNRLSLVLEAKKMLHKECIDNDVDVWIVFDVDAAPKGTNNPPKIKEEANSAISKCSHNKFYYAVSNDSFELWFLLHFRRDFAHHHRDEIVDKLSACIGFNYEKSTPMYELIKDKQDEAIARGKALCAVYPTGTPVSRCEPYTNVHELVEYLTKLRSQNKK